MNTNKLHTDLYTFDIYLTSSLLLSDAVTLNMAELGAATVNRILHDKSCSEEEFLKKLLNSRNNEEIVNHLKDSNRPREDFQVLQNITSPKIGL